MKTASITIRISEDEKERFNKIAAKKDVPLSQLIREAMREYLNQEEKGNE